MVSSFLLTEFGSPRFQEQPRGYSLIIIEEKNRRTLFSYSVIKEGDKFVVYHNVGRSMPSNSCESENISEALRLAFERVNKNARIIAEGTKLEYELVRNSEFLPENLENITFI